MAVIKLHTYCGNTCSAQILDTTKQARKTLNISKTLSGLAGDVSYAVDCMNDQLAVNADYFEFKAGGPYLAPGSFVEISSGPFKFIAVATDVPSNEFYNYYSIKAKTEIAIGRNGDHGICYNYGNFISNQPHCTLSHDKNYETFMLKNNSGSPSVYVNKQRVQNSVVLYFGDEISILGLSIVFLGAVLAVNNPQGLVKVNLPPSRDDIFNTAKPEQEYDFTRSTRIYKSPVSETFVIDGPNSGSKAQKLPAALTVGPAITMGVSMVSSTMISLSSAASSGASPVPGMLMSGSMLVGMLVWPNATRKWQNKRNKEEENNRKQSYLHYINRKKELIVKNLQHNTSIFNDNLVDSNTIVNWITDTEVYRRVWERSYYDDDFMEVRLGLGKRKNISEIEIPSVGYQVEEDELNSLAELLKNECEYMDQAPVSLDLKRLNSVGLIGNPALINAMIMNLVIQLAALHDSTELKLAFVYNDRNKVNYDWVKKLPHVWNSDMDFRLIANDKDEVLQLFRYLSLEYENRLSVENRRNTSPLPNYVVIVLDKELIEDVSLSKFVTADYEKTGFASLYAFGAITAIPNGCKAILRCLTEGNGIYSNIDLEKRLTTFQNDNIDMNGIYQFASAMTRLKSGNGQNKAGIPTTVTFLDLFKAGSIEEMQILSKWSESSAVKSLAVPIGIKNGGELFKLDIHEKFHGAHGLLAGTTGSGKSECIQTLILALAVQFHPDDVSFVLIDFKGGGMANCFIGMPHLAGTITNLGNQIRRSMVSLNAEIKRRQQMMKEAGVNHIDKYQALFKNKQVDIPMPHLVIISDEFAELKQQQPEFMSELISIARIGRSLGVHLILATQKPSGVVDDQIWSNTRFRISLKVADKSDSTGMIGVPDAAAITLAGRGYVQVGYNEVFELVQTAYTGADYTPVETYIDKEQQKVQMIDSCGQVAVSAEIKPKRIVLENEQGASGKKLSQLEALVTYLGELSIKNNIRPNLIWQEPLAKLLALSEIKSEAAEPFQLKATMGLIDDPQLQTLHPMVIDLSGVSHIVLYGMPGCGKTTFLQTLIYSMMTNYSTEEVQFNIFDFGGRVLEMFGSAPHSNALFFPDDSEKISDFFSNLIEELDVRRHLFARARQGNLAAYRKATGEKLPAILLVVDNFGKFVEQTYNFEEIFSTIVKEGAKYGITLIATASTVNTISYKYADYFTQKYTLLLADNSDYSAVLGSTMGMKPENVKGRGMMRYESRLVEYQTALALPEPDDAIRSESIIREIGKMAGAAKPAATKTSVEYEAYKPAGTSSVDDAALVLAANRSGKTSPVKSQSSGFSMPGLKFGQSNTQKKPEKVEVGFTTYAVTGNDALVIANNRKTGEKYALSLDGHPSFYILHKGEADQQNYGVNLANRIGRVQAVQVAIVTDRPLPKSDYLSRYQGESELNQLIDRIGKFDAERLYVVIDDLMDFYKAISDQDLRRLEGLLPLLKEKNIFIVAAARYEDAVILKDYPLGVFLFKTCPRGIFFGGKAIEAGSVLPDRLIQQLTYDELNFTTSAQSALLFDETGQNVRVVPEL